MTGEIRMIAGNVFLIGFMGTGKSTVALQVAERCAMEIVEMDETIAQREGRSISDIFATDGENYFRDLETEFLKELALETNKIVSCGGGVVLRTKNVSLMKKYGKVVLLTASPEEILKRLRDDDGRPLLNGKKNVNAISELMEQRRKRYEEAADIIICTDGKTKEEICDELLKDLEEMKER